MIFIVVKFKVKPECADSWMDKVAGFTEATRNEPGNLWFDWSRSVEDPNTFVLLEAFKEDGAEPHVTSDHFKKAITDMPPMLAETPEIINTTIEGQSAFGRMAEMKVD